MSVDEIERRIRVLCESAVKERDTDKKKLANFLQVIGLGRPVFEHLSVNGKNFVLGSCVNAGIISRNREPALQYFQDGIKLGAPVFKQLDALGKGLVIQCYASVWIGSLSSERLLQYCQDGIKLGTGQSRYEFMLKGL